MLNNVCIMGRITHTPEIRRTNNGTPVCSFAIACDRYRRKGEEKQTDFFDVVAWNRSAEFVTQYFGKGDSIIITGTLQTRQYTDKNGTDRRVVEIIANEINFAGGKNSKPENQNQTGTAQFAGTDDFDDSDIPF